MFVGIRNLHNKMYLGFAAIVHKLCMYPDYQERVYEEIMDVVGTDNKEQLKSFLVKSL